MRIWDISPTHLCRKHLLGEHRELHALWTILTENRRGYRLHPETKRWEGKLAALYDRHEELVQEMKHREYSHHSLLDRVQATGAQVQDVFINTKTEQIELLRAKDCPCFRG